MTRLSVGRRVSGFVQVAKRLRTAALACPVLRRRGPEPKGGGLRDHRRPRGLVKPDWPFCRNREFRRKFRTTRKIARNRPFCVPKRPARPDLTRPLHFE